ncbi:hypothetical protein FA13DRAFT_1716320 [Coprinellus micaceus]|uniref:C3H1-type domain-containing protein n=1 Tax=Coprinellus micaceus TaxID=71717 RepID=A0A4Y7SKD5_COPMI|nr:hypothetical protein FA13DRAFT_1716320 [Coprinellus micaceus]
MSKARTAPTANAGGQSSIPPPAGRSQAKCRFFAAGNCRKGTQCPFVHPPPKGCQSEPKGGRQNSNPEPSSSTRVHLSTESRASPERKEPNKSNDRRTSPQKGPKPQGKTSNRYRPQFATGVQVISLGPRRFPKKEEVASPNNPTKQPNPQPDSTLIERPPTTGPSKGKKPPQAIHKPYLQSIKAGKCTWGEACWYTYKLAAKRDSESGKENTSLTTGKGSQQPDVDAKTQTNKAQGTKKPCFAWAKGSCKQGEGCPYEHGGKATPSKQGKAPQAKPAGKKKQKPPATHTHTPHVREAIPAARPLSKEDATFLRAYEEADQRAQIWALRHEWGY